MPTEFDPVSYNGIIRGLNLQTFQVAVPFKQSPCQGKNCFHSNSFLHEASRAGKRSASQKKPTVKKIASQDIRAARLHVIFVRPFDWKNHCVTVPMMSKALGSGYMR